MSSFDFLDGMLFADDKVKAKCPESDLSGLKLRVYENGEVIPSRELVEKFNLEYGEGSSGVDIFLAHSWGAYDKTKPNLLFFTAVPRTEAKISLFSKETPDGSIMTSKFKSSELVTNLRALDADVFNIGKRANYNSSKRKAYVDIEIVVDKPITTQDNIYYVPKTISRGPDKGKETYVRRENITLYPIMLPEVQVSPWSFATTTRLRPRYNSLRETSVYDTIYDTTTSNSSGSFILPSSDSGLVAQIEEQADPAQDSALDSYERAVRAVEEALFGAVDASDQAETRSEEELPF